MSDRHWRLSFITVLLIVVATTGYSAVPVSGAEAVTMTLNGAINQGLENSPQAKQNRLSFEQQMIEAENTEREHEKGPPPDTMLGGPSEYQKDRVNELLPVQMEVTRDQAKATFIRDTADLRSTIIETYFNALLAQESAQLQADSVDRIQQQVKQAQLLFDQGVVAENDVRQAEAGLADARSQLFSARENADLGLLQLKQLLGMELSTSLLLTEKVEHDPRPSLQLADDIEQAQAASPEVRSARGNLKLAEKDLELYDRYSSYRMRGYREREIKVEQARTGLDQALRGVETQVRSLHSQLRQTAQRIEARQQQVALAERNLEIAQMRYQAGLITNLDVLNAESQLHQAELGHLQAVIDYKVAEAQLETLLGESSQSVRDHIENIQQTVDDML